MTLPNITVTVPTVHTPAPSRTQGQSDFDNNADAFLSGLTALPAAINGLAGQMNAQSAYVNDLAIQVAQTAEEILPFQQVAADYQAIFLGMKSTLPVVDNAGLPLAYGAMCVLETDGVLYVYMSSGWQVFNSAAVASMSESYKNAAQASASLSESARDAAQAARDAAQLSSGVYQTTAAGLSATVSGRYFSVPSASGDESLILYLNNSGAAQAVKAYPALSLFNRYHVAFGGDVVIDKQAGVVRYPTMRLLRNGETYKTLQASAYSLTVFEVPFRSVGAADCEVHYIDVSLIGSATNPVKTQTASTMPSLTSSTTVVLGVTFNGQYQCLWGGDVLYTNRPAIPKSASQKKPIILDRNNRLGGGIAVYVPVDIYLDLPIQDILTTSTVTNTVSAELAGYIKFVLSSASPAAVTSIYYDRTLNQYVMAVFSSAPEGDTTPFIPIIELWQDTVRSPFGFEIQSYDNNQLNNTRWPTVCMFNRRLVWDPANILGGGVALYLPRWLLIQRGTTVISRSTLMTESTELAGYVKITRPGSALAISAVFYNDSTQQVEWNVFGSSLDLKAALLDKVYLIAEFWGGGAIKTAYNWKDPRDNIESNQCAFGKLADQMPQRLAPTSIVDVTESNLVALGFTRGAADTTASNRPFFGDYFKSYTPQGKGVFRFYVQTDTADNFGSPAVYLWNTASQFTAYTPVLEKKLSSNAARYVLEIEALPNDSTMSFFYVGCNTQSTSVHTIITGVQYCTSMKVEGIALTDYPSPSAAVSTGTADIAARDAANVARSNALKYRIVSNLQKPTAKYNTKVVYGQSLGRGQETWPALSKTNQFGNLTLGSNVLPSSSDGATYPTFGSATLQPLAAQSVDGATQYSDVQEAALAAGNIAFGEPVNHGWVNFAKYLHNQQTLIDNDTGRVFVTFNPSVSGKTIEQLSKVNTQDGTNRYARFTDGLSKIEAATGTDTHVVDGLMWMQGEYNYADYGGSWTKAAYKTLYGTLIDDMISDVKTITGQALKPAFFSYQTGAGYTRDVDSTGAAGLHVGMAQLETSLEKDGVFMVGPVYPVTDKGGHLDSNGSRWYGHQIAKVYHRVVRLGQDWEPLRPIKIEQVGQVIYVDFHVPEPPLVFDLPYVVNAATDYSTKGFKVTDSSGTVGIGTVEIVGNSIVKLTLSRSTSGTAYVWYASQTTNGNGCLRDSDPTVALDKYEYKPSQGMYTSANIAALVNKPYPLHNWCVAFYLPVGYDEL